MLLDETCRHSLSLSSTGVHTTETERECVCVCEREMMEKGAEAEQGGHRENPTELRRCKP